MTILNTVIPILMHFFHIFTFKVYYFAPTASDSSNVKPDVIQSEATFGNDIGFETVYCRTLCYIRKCIRILVYVKFFCLFVLLFITMMSDFYLRCMGTPLCLWAMFTKGDNFCDFLFACSFKIGSTLNGKNLLLGEQILSFKSRPPFRWEAKMKMKSCFPWKCMHLSSR